MNNYQAEKLTDNWLRQNGIDPSKLNEFGVQLLQAQMIATNLLKHHAKLLGQNEAASLNNFLMAIRNSKQRRKLTLKSCYKVMNIGTGIKRKISKTKRQLKRG
jgi:predicted metal-dependent phosphoesterase TrpH